MWWFLAVVVGSVAVLVVIAWWMRQRNRDIDEEREYRDPPAFLWPPVG